MKPMTIAIIGIVLIIAAIAGTYIFVFQRPNPPLTENEVMIKNTIFTVEIASTSIAQARGLSFRDGLGIDQGMLFLFGSPRIQNFWMKDMKFPIDIIWIGGDRVVGFEKNVVPQPGSALWNLRVYSSPDGTDKVLEVNAGTVARDGIAIGDAVRIGQSE